MTTADNLNKLLEYLYDSHYGYLECAKEVTDLSLKNLFEDLAQKRLVMIYDIKALMLPDVKPESMQHGGSISGAMHRTLIDLKSFLTGGNKDAIIAEVKRGEYLTIDEYEKVINHVPNVINDLLKKQLNQIKVNLITVDKISQSKHAS